ncbi:MAG: response regulator [Fibrobacteria bacterium]|nr:response regulator [Fibrobacteria bacterium]
MMEKQSDREFEILLVEDNPGDVRLTMEALKASGSHCRLHTASDGVKAMDFLFKRGEYAKSPHPDLILLDLNLPRKDGREVLSEIKADSILKRIPVIVLTTSDDKNDVTQTYDLHANCYILKPIDIDHFIEVFHSINNFWFNYVTLPPRKR